MASPAGSPRPPSVERLLAAVRPRLDAPREPPALLAVARAVVAGERARLGSGTGSSGARAIDELALEVLARLDAFDRPGGPGLLPVINATGVILHTNLGRAPWPAAAIEAARAAAATYSLLELDAATGRRGPRFRVAEDHLVALTGAEDALIVNNNATAVALAVGLVGRRGVAVSRGELVEIGGGVRIPEIIRRAGARLVEVGTTNRTRADDFREPLATGRAGLVLRVHPSNFRQSGFVEAPDPRALAELARANGAIVVDDLGSGALLDTAAFGLPHEPTPADALAAGADLVTFSGDKLVGGPQAGLIVGRADLVARLRKDPLARATRPDKVILAAVAATLGLYRAGLAVLEIPVWRMVSAPVDGLRARSRAIAGGTAFDAAGGRSVDLVDLVATLGGGSLPGEGIPSAGLALRGGPADSVLARLRAGVPAVIGRIQDGAVVLDLRTVDPAFDAGLAAAIARALG
jgi:L-seryl-tRNA(Ser) seleniumtransferase